MLVYLTDRFYNPQDEGRIPYNDAVHPLRLGDAEQVSGYAHPDNRRRRIHRLCVRPHAGRPRPAGT